ADVTVYRNHVIVRHVIVLGPSDLVVLLAGHRLAARLPVDHVGRTGAAREDLGLDVHAPEPREPALRHRFGVLPKLLGRRVLEDVRHAYLLMYDKGTAPRARG